MASSLIRRDEPFSVGDVLHGGSGTSYRIEEIIADRRKPLRCVYRASVSGEKYILKNILRGDFEYQQELQRPLSAVPNLRTVVDTISDGELFVYRFLAGDLLRFSQRPLSDSLRRALLKLALTGLAELHDRNITHSDIKPNNILIDYEDSAGNDVNVHSVQISDLEDAVLLPPGKNLQGCLSGNQLWRSPESWARARQNIASDVFSFGIVAIYVMLNNMVFWTRDVEAASSSNDEAWQQILRRHISYFADEDGFQGLLEHIGKENPFYERLVAIAPEVKPREPFGLWEYVDKEFRDLIVKMTSLDPVRRITAREALKHPWFCQEGSWNWLNSTPNSEN